MVRINPRVLVRKHGVEHQVKVRARMSVQCAAVDANLHRAKILIFRKVPLGVRAQRYRTCGAPSESGNKLNIEVCLCAHIIVAVLKSMVGGFQSGEVRSATNGHRRLCIRAILVEHLGYRHGAEWNGVVIDGRCSGRIVR